MVHGAFADAASYARVIPELTATGLEVVAPAVSNRSVVDDALVHTPFPGTGATGTGTDGTGADVSVAVDRFPALFAADIDPALAGMTTVEVDSSHLVMLSQPQAVADLTQDAVRSTAL
ncbi:hypothetical protein [Streptomyces sp. NPDC059063]|uniref:hypothetical protein n=1 Tax=unclassified Streptomyces TaxID=2593676 RepID=UPI00367CD399